MGPEWGAAVAAGISGGIVIVKIFERFWPQNGGNGKIERLLTEQLELMKKEAERSIQLDKTLALMQAAMEQHDRRALQAWQDAFAILRK